MNEFFPRLKKEGQIEQDLSVLEGLEQCSTCTRKFLPGNPPGWDRPAPRHDPGLCPNCTLQRRNALIRAGEATVQDFVGPGSLDDLVRRFLGKKYGISRLQIVTEEESAALDADLARKSKRCGSLTGIPEKFRNASVETALPTAAMGVVADWLTRDGPAHGRALWLCGPTDGGKTWAAVAGLRAAGGMDRAFLLWPVVAPTAAGYGPAAEKLKAELCETRFVVIDELTLDDLRWEGLLDTICVARDAYKRPAIITTNLTVEELNKRLTDRIRRRIRDGWASFWNIWSRERAEPGVMV